MKTRGERGGAPGEESRGGGTPGSAGGRAAGGDANGDANCVMSGAERAVIDVGGARVRVLSGGGLRLDGGAMFGIIPRPLWTRGTPADEQNRIALGCNCLVVEWDDATPRRVIVETGHGSKYSTKEQSLYAIDPARWLGAALADAGVAVETITDVIVTHLHFDHAGGLTEPLDGGAAPGDARAIAARPTFPAAAVHVQRREFDDARANFGIMTMTYREENFAPLDEAGAWRWVDGPAEVIAAPRPGMASIRVLPAPGHTRGHQAVLIGGRDRTLLFPGDVIPTRAHVGRPYNMGYDLFPLDNRETKGRLLARAAAEEWLIVLDHEPERPVVRAVREGDWFRLEAVG